MRSFVKDIGDDEVMRSRKQCETTRRKSERIWHYSRGKLINYANIAPRTCCIANVERQFQAIGWMEYSYTIGSNTGPRWI